MSAPPQSKPLLVCTQSPLRRKFFENIPFEEGVEFTSVDIDEKAIGERENPNENIHDVADRLVRKIARAKLDACMATLPDATKYGAVLTFDSVAVGCGQIWEKPENNEECRYRLSLFSPSFPLYVVSAVAIMIPDEGFSWCCTEGAVLTFKEALPSAVIGELLRKGEGLTRCTGLNLEDPLIAPYLKHIRGRRETLLGVPLGVMFK